MRRLLCVFPVLVLLAACGGDSNPAAPGPTTIPPQPFTATDLRVGTGAEAVNGKTVSVNYAGMALQPDWCRQQGHAL